ATLRREHPLPDDGSRAAHVVRAGRRPRRRGEDRDGPRDRTSTRLRVRRDVERRASRRRRRGLARQGLRRAAAHRERRSRPRAAGLTLALAPHRHRGYMRRLMPAARRLFVLACVVLLAGLAPAAPVITLLTITIAPSEATNHLGEIVTVE